MCQGDYCLGTFWLKDFVAKKDSTTCYFRILGVYLRVHSIFITINVQHIELRNTIPGGASNQNVSWFLTASTLTDFSLDLLQSQPYRSLLRYWSQNRHRCSVNYLPNLRFHFLRWIKRCRSVVFCLSMWVNLSANRNRSLSITLLRFRWIIFDVNTTLWTSYPVTLALTRNVSFETL